MKKAYITGKKQIGIFSEEVPALKKHTVLIRVIACGICGTDKILFKTTNKAIKKAFGHEVVGEIVGYDKCVSDEIKKIKYVTLKSCIPCEKCDPCISGRIQNCLSPETIEIGGFAQYILIDQKFVVPISDESFVNIFVEPMSVAMSLCSELNTQAKKVCVVGMGTIGCLCVAYLKHCGFEVDAINKNSGAAGVNWIKLFNVNAYPWDLFGNTSANWDALIVTTPYVTLKEMTPNINRGGLLLFNGFDGNINSYQLINLSEIHRKNIMLKGVYSRPQIFINKAKIYVNKYRDEFESIPTGIYSFNNIQEAFEKADSGKYLKNIIKMN